MLSDTLSARSGGVGGELAATATSRRHACTGREANDTTLWREGSGAGGCRRVLGAGKAAMAAMAVTVVAMAWRFGSLGSSDGVKRRFSLGLGWYPFMPFDSYLFLANCVVTNQPRQIFILEALCLLLSQPCRRIELRFRLLANNSVL
ncbi:uncharacterized protein LOC133910524 [Phragmites australis]|uniref:uncharacterized protein LOC133910524 n=1 Tax=Phragmites australis TaxID=29695 RepID=UPI002D78DE47|nr:uncharacterized protein LOC133910524 [Phragmites australis]